MHGDDLPTVDLDLAHHAAVIAGPPRSGRSAALTTIAEAAQRRNGVARRILVSAWHSPSTVIPVWTDRWCLDTYRRHRRLPAHRADRAPTLRRCMRRRRPGRRARPSVERRRSDEPTLVAFDDLADLFDLTAHRAAWTPSSFASSTSDARRPVRVVVASEADALGRCYEDSVRRLRSGRTGILLTPDPDLGGSLLHAALPRRDDLPAPRVAAGPASRFGRAGPPRPGRRPPDPARP